MSSNSQNLKSIGLKATFPRLKILDLFQKAENRHLTAEDVFKRLAAEVPALNGLTFSKIGDLGTPVLETAEKIPLLEREKERKAKGIIVG